MTDPMETSSRVILIGDSIRMGYEARVRERLGSSTDIWSPSENGGDSRNLLAHLQDWILDRPADLIHLNCGLHDIKRPRGESGFQVAPQEFAQNVAELLDRIGQATRADVVWATITPVVESRHRQRGNFPFDRFSGDVSDYNRLALLEARKRNVAVNDLHDFVRRHGKDAMVGPDGVHYTDEGYRVLGDHVAGFIAARLALRPKR